MDEIQRAEYLIAKKKKSSIADPEIQLRWTGVVPLLKILPEKNLLKSVDFVAPGNNLLNKFLECQPVGSQREERIFYLPSENSAKPRVLLKLVESQKEQQLLFSQSKTTERPLETPTRRRERWGKNIHLVCF